MGYFREEELCTAFFRNSATLQEKITKILLSVQGSPGAKACSSDPRF